MGKKIRQAVRTVVINSKKEVLLVHAVKDDYFQLPGGGVKASEDFKKAALRETLEETGYRVNIIAALGSFDEVGDKMINRSYGYLAEVSSFTTKALNKDELDFTNEWYSLKEALTIMNKYLEKSKRGKYKSFFTREVEFLNRGLYKVPKTQ